MPTSPNPPEPLSIRLINSLGRIVGVWFIVAGFIGFAMSALVPTNRVMNLVASGLAFAVGVGLWVARPATSKEVSERFGSRSDDSEA